MQNGRDREQSAAGFRRGIPGQPKYLAFAKQADREGFPQVARLFRAAAAAETVHAHAHLRAMKGVGNTAENLRAAITGETHEFEQMYPPMITAAEAEGHKAAARSFAYANAVEKTHADLYRKALEQIDHKDEFGYYVCSVCGHTHEQEAPEQCPVCGAKRGAFERCE